MCGFPHFLASLWQRSRLKQIGGALRLKHDRDITATDWFPNGADALTRCLNGSTRALVVWLQTHQSRADAGTMVHCAESESNASSPFAGLAKDRKSMVQTKIPLERAFELARSGKFANVADLRSQLGKEGYQTEQLSGGSLLRQLREIIKAAVKS